MGKIIGKAWVAKKYVMSYEMVLQKYWTSPVDKTENAKWIMAGVDEAFNQENGFKDQGYTFIVAGHNFAGGGKSIEHCVTGLMGAGIKAVFATSFARLQFRNAINYGLPFVTVKDMNLACETGDMLEYDNENGIVVNMNTGKTFECVPVAHFVEEVAKYGGLMEFIKAKIQDGSVHSLR